MSATVTSGCSRSSTSTQRVDFFDEFADELGVPRAHYAGLAQTLRSIDIAEFRTASTWSTRCCCSAASRSPSTADSRGTERILPFDLIPRIVTGDEWALIKRGIAQRVRAQRVPGRRLRQASASCARAHPARAGVSPRSSTTAR
jgi:uncharacterized circularly permuted ATP-grasp superfamily protein